MLRNIVNFDSEELLAPCPTPKLEDHPLSAVRDCVSNLFVELPSISVDRSSLRNVRTHHAVMTGTHLTLFFIFKRLR